MGIPFTEGENTNAIVTEIGKLLEVKVKPEDISTSHRLPARPPHNNNRKPSVNARCLFCRKRYLQQDFCKSQTFAKS